MARLICKVRSCENFVQVFTGKMKIYCICCAGNGDCDILRLPRRVCAQDKLFLVLVGSLDVAVKELIIVSHFQHLQAFGYEKRAELPEFFIAAEAVHDKTEIVLFAVTCDTIII